MPEIKEIIKINRSGIIKYGVDMTIKELGIASREQETYVSKKRTIIIGGAKYQLVVSVSGRFLTNPIITIKQPIPFSCLVQNMSALKKSYKELIEWGEKVRESNIAGGKDGR